MAESTKCYAVCSGEYDYFIEVICRRREDAEARVRKNNEQPVWLLDGEPYLKPFTYADRDAYRTSGRSLVRNPARRNHVELYVEEFNYYEGEPLPAPLEET